jgi:outer membrane protein assembly factor BamE (lipoprotein component of BamABCDE complex)
MASPTSIVGPGESAGRMRLLAAVLLAALAAQGCLSMAEVSHGNPVALEDAKHLKAGESRLDQVLEALGAPLEVHRHPDATLLVYRHRKRRTFRLGLSLGSGTSYLKIAQVAAVLLNNLRFTLERVHADEDRLVVILDPKGVVQGISFRSGTHDLPFY